MGLNTVRYEGFFVVIVFVFFFVFNLFCFLVIYFLLPDAFFLGKFDAEYMYRIADEMGVLMMVGWSCCDAWQRLVEKRGEIHIVAFPLTFFVQMESLGR